MSLSINLILSAFLIFLRVTGFFLSAPFFNGNSIPNQIKLYAAIIFSFLILNVLVIQDLNLALDLSIIEISILIIREILIGVCLGITGQIIFAGLDLAGSLISYQTSLSFANMVDASTQQQNSVLSNLLTTLGVLVFLGIGGEKILLNGLIKSFEIVPLSAGNIFYVGPYLLEIATFLFLIGLQITIPFIFVILLIDLSLAIFARIMPQVNLLFISLPIKFGVGLVLLILLLPYLPTIYEILFARIPEYLIKMIEVVSG